MRVGRNRFSINVNPEVAACADAVISSVAADAQGIRRELAELAHHGMTFVYASAESAGDAAAAESLTRAVQTKIGDGLLPTSITEAPDTFRHIRGHFPPTDETAVELFQLFDVGLHVAALAGMTARLLDCSDTSNYSPAPGGIDSEAAFRIISPSDRTQPQLQADLRSSGLVTSIGVFSRPVDSEGMPLLRFGVDFAPGEQGDRGSANTDFHWQIGPAAEAGESVYQLDVDIRATNPGLNMDAEYYGDRLAPFIRAFRIAANE